MSRQVDVLHSFAFALTSKSRNILYQGVFITKRPAVELREDETASTRRTPAHAACDVSQSFVPYYLLTFSCSEQGHPHFVAPTIISAVPLDPATSCGTCKCCPRVVLRPTASSIQCLSFFVPNALLHYPLGKPTEDYAFLLYVLQYCWRAVSYTHLTLPTKRIV